MGNVKLLPTPEQDTQGTIRTNSHARDEFQQHIDGIVQKVVKDWHDKGQKSPDKAPFVRLTVAKTDVADLKSAIRRAFTLHKHAPVFFKDAVGKDGNVTVKVTPAALPPKPKPTADAPQSQDAGSNG